VVLEVHEVVRHAVVASALITPDAVESLCPKSKPEMVTVPDEEEIEFTGRTPLTAGALNVKVSAAVPMRDATDSTTLRPIPPYASALVAHSKDEKVVHDVVAQGSAATAPWTWPVVVKSAEPKLSPEIVIDAPPDMGALGTAARVSTAESNVNMPYCVPIWALTVSAIERVGTVAASIAAIAQRTEVPAVHDGVAQTSAPAAIEIVAVASTATKFVPVTVKLEPWLVGRLPGARMVRMGGSNDK